MTRPTMTYVPPAVFGGSGKVIELGGGYRTMYLLAELIAQGAL